jgi:hypothetical protein
MLDWTHSDAEGEGLSLFESARAEGTLRDGRLLALDAIFDR